MSNLQKTTKPKPQSPTTTNKYPELSDMQLEVVAGGAPGLQQAIENFVGYFK